MSNARSARYGPRTSPYARRRLWDALGTVLTAVRPEGRGNPISLRSFALTAVVWALTASPASGSLKHYGSCSLRPCAVYPHYCSNRDPRACVLRIIRAKDIQEPERSWLLRVPYCESRWKPSERPNREGATGLYQFLPSTFAGTPQGNGHPERIYSAYWQTLAAHWLYNRDDGGSEWECK